MVVDFREIFILFRDLHGSKAPCEVRLPGIRILRTRIADVRIRGTITHLGECD